MEEPTLYQPVERGKGSLSEQVARQIIDLIARKQLETGDRLPSSDELTGYLEISRTAMREAIKLLDAWGVVTVRHGVGTFVAELSVDALTIPIKVSAERKEEAVFNLHQIREALEPYIAAIAARNARPEHIEEMEESLHRMDQAIDNPSEYIPADLDFHSALAKATGNDLFLIVIHPVIDLLQDVRRLTQKTQGALERGQSSHWMIFEHVKAGRAEKAREAMLSHLNQVWLDFQAQLDC